jgi:hypothetical protein
MTRKNINIIMRAKFCFWGANYLWLVDVQKKVCVKEIWSALPELMDILVIHQKMMQQ